MSTEEFEANIVGGPAERGNVRTTKLTGADLDQSYIGKFLGRSENGYNRLGKIVQLIPVISDPNGLWLATIHWGATPADSDATEKVKLHSPIRSKSSRSTGSRLNTLC